MPRRVLTEPSEGIGFHFSGVANDNLDNENSDYVFYMYDEIRNDRKEEYFGVYVGITSWRSSLVRALSAKCFSVAIPERVWLSKLSRIDRLFKVRLSFKSKS